MRYPPLLKTALSSNQFGRDVKFKNGRLIGNYAVYPDRRAMGAMHIFGIDCSINRFDQNTYTNTLLLSPQYIDPKYIVSEFEADPPTILDMLSLKHGLAEIDESLYWDTPYCAEAHCDGGWVERIKSTFLSFEKGEPAGFFGFQISFLRDVGHASYIVDLDLVHVRPQFRHFGNHGLDLSVAVTELAMEIYVEILKRYRGRTPVDVILQANLDSRGGEKLSHLFQNEFEHLMFSLRNDEHVPAPNIGKKVGEFSPEFEEMRTNLADLPLTHPFWVAVREYNESIKS